MYRKNLSCKNLIIRSVLAVIVLAVMVLCWFYQDSFFPGTAYADSEYHSDVLVDGYSLVLDDLKQDSSFDPNEYPEDNTDYSMSLIQIAESDSDELFLYVYQPYTGNDYDLTASAVSISLTEADDDNLSFKVYTLTLCNFEGVFYKYRVDDLKFVDTDFDLAGTSMHYYTISAIYRPYYSKIDDGDLLDNTTSQSAFSVGQEWQVLSIMGDRYYWCSETRVVELEPYVSWVRYISRDDYHDYGNHNYLFDWTDSYFVAFKCDFDIDTLLEADVSYVVEYYENTNTKNGYADSDNANKMKGWVYDDNTFYLMNEDSSYYDTPKSLLSEVTDKVVQKTYLFRKTTYFYDEIMTPDEFYTQIETNGKNAKSIEYNDELKSYVDECDYVLNVDQFGGYNQHYMGAYFGYFSRIRDLTILRLKYDFQGIIYNVGVVSDIVSPNSDVKDGSFAVVDNGKDTSCWDSIRVWVWIILAIVVFILLLPILPYIVKAVVWIVCAPFKFIRWCYRKNKERKRKKQEKQDQKKADQEQKNKDQNIQVKDSLSSGIKLDSSIKFDVPEVSDDSAKSGKDKKKKNE